MIPESHPCPYATSSSGVCAEPLQPASASSVLSGSIPMLILIGAVAIALAIAAIIMRKKRIRLLSKQSIIIVGLLLALITGAVIAVNYFAYPHFAPRLAVTQSYGTGHITITFRNDTPYSEAQRVLSKLGLANTRDTFMQPSVTIVIPVSVEHSSIADLNAFNVTIDQLKRTAGVKRVEGSTVYFDPTLSETAARKILSQLNISIAPSAKFQKDYQTEVTVPTGQEPKYINDLLRESSVNQASEPVATTNR
jgi:hypothetical protein